MSTIMSAVENVASLRAQLISDISDLSIDGEATWNKLLADLQIYNSLIVQRFPLLCESFTAYRQLWNQLLQSLPPELLEVLMEMDNHVKLLDDWFVGFQERSQAGISTTQKLIEEYKPKSDFLLSLNSRVLSSDSEAELQAISLADFKWLSEENVPNAVELMDEWNNKRPQEVLNRFILELDQMTRAPMDVLVDAYLSNSRSTTPSSSGSNERLVTL